MHDQSEYQHGAIKRQSSSPPSGKLGVLIPGMGAIATTFVGGVFAIRHGLGKPIGALSQMGTMSMGSTPVEGAERIGEMVSLARLDDLVFGGWGRNVFSAPAAALAMIYLSWPGLAAPAPEAAVGRNF